MQIIDELEMSKRGPYGGGIGHVSFTGGMDMALALRTMVIPTAATDTLYDYGPDKGRREWVIHVQAGAGLVADSVRAPFYFLAARRAAAIASTMPGWHRPPCDLMHAPFSAPCPNDIGARCI